MTPKPDDSWEFWRRSKQALNELENLMAQIAPPYIAEGRILSREVVKDVRRNLLRFQQSFSLLVHAQKKV